MAEKDNSKPTLGTSALQGSATESLSSIPIPPAHEMLHVECENSPNGLGLQVEQKTGKVSKLDEGSPSRGILFVNDTIMAVNKIKVGDDWKAFEKELNRKMTGGNKYITVEVLRGNRDIPEQMDKQINKRFGFEYFYIEINARKERDRQLGIAMVKKDHYILVSNLAKASLGSDKLKVYDRVLAVNGQFDIKSEHQAKSLVKASKHGMFDLIIERPLLSTALKDFTTKISGPGDDTVLSKDITPIVHRYFETKPFGAPMGPAKPSILKKKVSTTPEKSKRKDDEQEAISFHGGTSFTNQSPNIPATAHTKYPSVAPSNPIGPASGQSPTQLSAITPSTK